MRRSLPLGKFTVRTPFFAEYRPSSLDAVLPSNFSVTSPTLGDLPSTLDRKHQPVRSLPLNRLLKPGSGCQSSAWAVLARVSRTTRELSLLMGVTLEIGANVPGPTRSADRVTACGWPDNKGDPRWVQSSSASLRRT